MSSDRYKTPGRARDPAGLGARWTSQLDNHCCDLIDRIAAPTQSNTLMGPPLRSPTTASISRTHSQCQRRSIKLLPRFSPRIWFLHSWKKWWSQPGSNRRPQACKASALPTELWPLTECLNSGVLPLRPFRELRGAAVVGREGVEPSTSRLSGVRSNHLSYRPPCLASQ